eukprot:scaffold177877_cov27-Prasinocladus_malaysianus.AAC.1
MSAQRISVLPLSFWSHGAVKRKTLHNMALNKAVSSVRPMLAYYGPSGYYIHNLALWAAPGLKQGSIRSVNFQEAHI